MKNLLITVLICTVSIVLNAQTVKLPKFSGISTSGNVVVELIEGSQPKAEYTILKGNEEDLEIEVKNDILHVKINYMKNFFGKKNTKAKVIVYHQQLSKINVSAGSSLSNNQKITSDELTVGVSSGASAKLYVDAADISISASSGASMTISVQGKVVDFSASSGASIKAIDLHSEDVQASTSSGSSISLHATEKLKAKASSGSDIRFVGDPKVKDVKSSSGGSISRS